MCDNLLVKRRNLLIVLLIAVCIWAFLPQDDENAYAKESPMAVAVSSTEPPAISVEDPGEALPSAEVTSASMILPAAAAEPVPEEVDIIQVVPPLQPAVTVIHEPQDDKQWALAMMDLPALWHLSTGSAQTRVAVLDTGIDANHPDLKGQVVAETNLVNSSQPGDVHGHGTHVAGIVAARDNNRGIIGVAPDCSLLNAKVADDTGRCEASDLAKGIIWAVDNGADIINISIEIHEPYVRLEEAVDYAWEHDSLVIAAAGNGGSETPVYPASYENCLAVSAIDSEHGFTRLANHGEWIDLAAPGSDIYSTLPDNGYGYKSGTSFACAYVSGIAALLFDVAIDHNENGRLNDDVADILKSSCWDLDLSGSGHGLISASQTLDHLD